MNAPPYIDVILCSKNDGPAWPLYVVKIGETPEQALAQWRERGKRELWKLEYEHVRYVPEPKP